MADNMDFTNDLNGAAADQQTENQQAGKQGTGERMFTQEEVTRIVSSRLARAKLDAAHSTDFQQREADLSRRELELDTREALEKAGLPKELAKVINCADKETMLNSIKTLQGLYGSAGMSGAAAAGAATGTRYRVSTGTSGNSNGSGSLNSKPGDAEIRKAMGLKG